MKSGSSRYANVYTRAAGKNSTSLMLTGGLSLPYSVLCRLVGCDVALD
jgi:hypothetical protein